MGLNPSVMIAVPATKIQDRLGAKRERKKENHRNRKALEHLQIEIQVRKEWTSSWLDQFMIIFRRTFRERRRDYFDMLRLVQSLGVAVVLGLLWWKSKTDTEAHLRDQVMKLQSFFFFFAFVLKL